MKKLLLTLMLILPLTGIAQHNPGNIKTGNNWIGEVACASPSKFECFSHPIYGYRAMARVLKNYQKIYGLASVKDIITRWAPSTENDTANYIKFVEEAIGSPTVDTDNVVQLAKLMQAISIFEHGVRQTNIHLIMGGISMEAYYT